MAVTKETRDAITRIEKERLQSDALRREEQRKHRQADNLMLVDKLRDIIEGHPDLRFGQIVTSLFVGDDLDGFFYDEPSRTLEILEGKLNNIGKF